MFKGCPVRGGLIKKQEEEMKKILVIGSLNMDCVIKTPHMPKSGETIMGDEVVFVPGGKGANQAYAVGRLGGNLAMIGAVGNDSFGSAMLDNLRSVGVDTGRIAVMEGVRTGQAYITVDHKGENSIIVIAGANAKVTKEMIEANIDLLEESDIVIMQMEIPVETVIYAKEKALGLNKTIIVDPAPAVPDLPDDFWQGIDYIKPNETELEILTNIHADSEEQIEKGAREMLRRGVKNVIVSLGEKGCFYCSERKSKWIPTEKVKVVDTTAAGDSFTAAFALALCKDQSVEEAIKLGQKVSGIVVTREGAQSSIPGPEEVM